MKEKIQKQLKMYEKVVATIEARLEQNTNRKEKEIEMFGKCNPYTEQVIKTDAYNLEKYKKEIKRCKKLLDNQLFEELPEGWRILGDAFYGWVWIIKGSLRKGKHEKGLLKIK